MCCGTRFYYVARKVTSDIKTTLRRRPVCVHTRVLCIRIYLSKSFTSLQTLFRSFLQLVVYISANYEPARLLLFVFFYSWVQVGGQHKNCIPPSIFSGYSVPKYPRFSVYSFVYGYKLYRAYHK